MSESPTHAALSLASSALSGGVILQAALTPTEFQSWAVVYVATAILVIQGVLGTIEAFKKARQRWREIDNQPYKLPPRSDGESWKPRKRN